MAEGLLFMLKRNGTGRTLLELIRDYLNGRYQRVVLNGKSSSWKEITAGVPQGSVLGPLLFLIYINDLCDDLSCDVKLFADDTSLFTMVFNENISAQNLNSNLRKIQEWAFQWKMQFNPDPLKQAVQVLFSIKKVKPKHPPIYFNGTEVVTKTEQKHLGFILDKQLNFDAHLKEVIGKAKRGIGVIKFMSRYVTRDILDQIYKLYVGPHLDYGDVLYHQYDPNLLESVQYSAALAVTGAWRGTNTDKIYEESGWESLYHRRCYRCMTLFYKIVNECTPEYLRAPINLARVKPYSFRNSNVLEPINSHTNRFDDSFTLFVSGSGII